MVEAFLENMPLVLTVVGLVLMVLEALSPGAHLIVIGVALLGAGIIGMLFGPLGPFALSALVLVIGAVATYAYRELDIYGNKGTPQTSDSSSLAGATGYVTETVTTRGGQVKLEDAGFSPYYSARTTSGTIEEGEEIIVLDPGGGNVVTVDRFGAMEEDEIDRQLARDAAGGDGGTGAESADVDASSSGADAAESEGATDGDSETDVETEEST